MSKIRIKSADIIKNDISLNLLKDLPTLYIRIFVYFVSKRQNAKS